MDNNLRTKKTKKILREALESLLRDKSLDDITVKEICEKASINRVTFYDHYLNKEELHNEMISEIEHNIIKEFKKDESIYYMDKNYKKIIQKLTDYFDNNRKHFNLVLSNHKNRLLFTSILHKYFMKYLRRGIKVNSDKYDKKEIDSQILIKSQFISGALIYSFSWWLKDGFDISKEEFLKYICNLLDDLFEKNYNKFK